MLRCGGARLGVCRDEDDCLRTRPGRLVSGKRRWCIGNGDTGEINGCIGMRAGVEAGLSRRGVYMGVDDEEWKTSGTKNGNWGRGLSRGRVNGRGRGGAED